MGDAVRDGVATGEPDQTIDGVEQRRDPCVPELPSAAPRTDYPELVAVERAHYVVSGVLAQGGVGRILQARDLRLGREVAIKELLPQHRDAVRRFEREARITARLQHPAIIHVYEAGVWSGGEPFYAMPMVAGRSLDKVVAERATLNERLGLLPNVIAIADALAYAHSESVIHRDLKPSNVLVGEFGETVVIDWGLAKDVGAPGDPKESLRLPVSSQDTVSGSVVGTPAYMPPEQARGEAVDQRADVYALGALLYKVLAGVAPYLGESSKEVLELVKAGPPPRVHEREPGTPPDLAAIVAKAMAREPIHRYPSASALAQDLKRFQTGQLVAAHRYTTPELVWRGLKRYRVVVAAAVILVVVAGLMFRKVLIEKARAEAGRIAILEERGRTELLAGHAGNALAYLLGAAHDGVTGGARGFQIADAMRPFQAEEKRLVGGPLVAVSPDGNHMITAGIGDVTLWVVTGRDQDAKHLGSFGTVHAVTFDRAGKRVAAGGEDGAVRIWNVDTGTLVAKLGPLGPVNGIGFSPDGTRIVVASRDRTASVWDLATGKRITTSTCHTASVVSASFSPDGTQVVTASEDNSACVWSASSAPDADAVVYAQLRGHTNVVNAAIWTPDGRRVVTAASDGTARVWTADHGKLVVAPLRHERNSVVAVVAISSDGRYVVSAGSDKVARVWELPKLPNTPEEEGGNAAAREVTTLVGHTGPIVAVAFSDDDNLVATAGLDKLAKIWDVTTGRVRATFEHDSAVASVAFASGTRKLITGERGKTGESRIWNAEVSRRLDVDSPLHAIAVTRDGTVAAARNDTNVTLVPRGDLTRDVMTLHGHLGRVSALAFTPDGRYLISGGDDRDLIVWDVKTGQRHATLPGTTTPTLALATSADSTLVAAATGSVVRVYALSDGALLHELADEGTKLQAVAFGANGSVVAGAEDGVIVMWARDGTRLDPYATRRGPITAIAFSLDADRSTVAIAGLTWVLLFHIKAGRLEPLPTRIDESMGLHAVALSEDSTRVITAGTDGAHVWDVATGKLIGTRDDHTLITGLALHDDTLWTASEDGTIDAWDVRVETRPVGVIEREILPKAPWRLDDDDHLQSTH
jgi:WD40 repeat protein